MTSDAAVASLIRRGATLTPTVGGVPIPVGLMQRVGPERWFWWAAGGDTEFDGHLIDADDVRVWHDGMAVEFRSRGEFAGYLTAIEESIDEADGVERARKTLSDWAVRYGTDAALRGFIVRQMAAAQP